MNAAPLLLAAWAVMAGNPAETPFKPGGIAPPRTEPGQPSLKPEPAKGDKGEREAGEPRTDAAIWWNEFHVSLPRAMRTACAGAQPVKEPAAGLEACAFDPASPAGLEQWCQCYGTWRAPQDKAGRPALDFDAARLITDPGLAVPAFLARHAELSAVLEAFARALPPNSKDPGTWRSPGAPPGSRGSTPSRGPSPRRRGCCPASTRRSSSASWRGWARP
jgi:hypothetical protein